MILADFLPAIPDRSWALARQVGVTHAIVKAAPELTGLEAPWRFETLRTIQRRFAAEGFVLAGLEGDQFDMQRIKLGQAGCEEDFDRYRRMLANMGELGIPLLSYNFMATIGWCRTTVDLPARGGARSNRFALRDLEKSPVAEAERATEEAMWKNYERFLAEVLPAAEEAGVSLSLHPDDPPLSPLRGIGRIFSTVAAFQRAMALSGSSSHGVTFCQANFSLMERPVAESARLLAARIKYLHFRDVRGTAEDFVETFHDEGPTDMPAMLRLYGELGLDVPIRVDHVPTMAGEDNSHHGYALLGRLFAVGYLKGILDASGIPCR